MNPEPSSVLVALSGGEDSALAAALLKAQGWQVKGMHLLLPGPAARAAERQKAVREVGERLQISVSYIPVEEVFTRKVIEPFVEAYLRGYTPNPCVVCNQRIKFDFLLRQAEEEGSAFIATGHYAVIRRPEEGPAELWRGKDRSKDQSYFLHRLEQHHLRRTVFPLGGMIKAETRRLAVRMNLPAFLEGESQEICFVPDDEYRLFLENRKGMGIAKKGNIVTRKGEKVGEHLGAYRFTVGQRHGLGIASPMPYYVMEIRAEENEVIVGRKPDLFKTVAEAESFNWIAGKASSLGARILGQIRYRHVPGFGRLNPTVSGGVRFEFEKPQWAITPGQALACYEGDRLLGGGWIKKVQGARSTVQGSVQGLSNGKDL